MKYRFFRSATALAALAVLATGSTAAPLTDTVDTLADSDRWYYPFNFTPGFRADGPVFAFFPSQQTPSPPFFGFNTRDGEVVLQFKPTLPAQAQSLPFTVTSARLEWYDAQTASWDPNVGNHELGEPQRIEVFAAGFGPTYSENAWTGGETYIGGGDPPPAINPFTPQRDRDPYPRDLVTDAHVENDVSAAVTPWALGVPDAGYIPGAMTDAFVVTADFDVNDATIQNKLQADLYNELSTWIVTSTFYADPANSSGGGVNAGLNPRVLMTEAVGVSGYGASQQPPRLVIEIEYGAPVAAAENWALYQ